MLYNNSIFCAQSIQCFGLSAVGCFPKSWMWADGYVIQACCLIHRMPRHWRRADHLWCSPPMSPWPAIGRSVKWDVRNNPYSFCLICLKKLYHGMREPQVLKLDLVLYILFVYLVKKMFLSEKNKRDVSAWRIGRIWPIIRPIVKFLLEFRNRAEVFLFNMFENDTTGF